MAEKIQVQKIAAHALIKKGKAYLVTRRSQKNDWQPGKWDLPGGTIEFGENPESALRREVMEETALTITTSGPLYVYAALSSPTRHQFQIVYACDYQEGAIRLNPEEHDEYRWASLDEMSALPTMEFLTSLLTHLTHLENLKK